MLCLPRTVYVDRLDRMLLVLLAVIEWRSSTAVNSQLSDAAKYCPIWERIQCRRRRCGARGRARVGWN